MFRGGFLFRYAATAIVALSVACANPELRNPAMCRSDVPLRIRSDTPVEGVKAWLAHHKDINYVESGQTLLDDAAFVGNVRVCRFLLSKGAHIDPTSKERFSNRDLSALSFAAMSGSSETVQLLIKSGANVNFKGSNGETPLILACSYYYHPGMQTREEKLQDLRNRTEIVRLLLVNGADPNIRDRDGDTALKYAQQLRSLEILQLLEKFGATE